MDKDQTEVRKLIVEEWISLDGCVSDKNGKLDFFASLVRDTYAENSATFLKKIDCILLGRKTYEQFAKTWPERPIENELLARRMNETQKIVFSSTLVNAPWGKWQKAVIEKGSPVARIKDLKLSGDGHMVVLASISLAQGLMKENLVDEYHLFLCPSITGGGRRFFTDEISPTTLKLSETSQYKNGVIFLNYQPTQP